MGLSMQDLAIDAFEKQLIEYINGVPLPWTVKRLVLKEVYEGVEQTAYQVVAQQRATLQKGAEDDKGLQQDKLAE